MADDSFYEKGAGTQHPSFGSTPHSNSSANQTYDRALRSVTVRQMVDAQRMHSTANFTVEGMEIVDVMTVANVLSMKTYPTRNEYYLVDGTDALIRAQQWQSDTHDSDYGLNFNELDYVCVVGTLDAFQNRNYLKINQIRKVVNSYEPFHHFLKVLVDTLAYERGPPPLELTKSLVVEDQVEPQTSQPVDDSAAEEALRGLSESSSVSPAASDVLSSPVPASHPDHTPHSPVARSQSSMSATTSASSAFDNSHRRHELPVSPKSNTLDKGKARAHSDNKLSYPSDPIFTQDQPEVRAGCSTSASPLKRGTAAQDSSSLGTSPKHTGNSTPIRRTLSRSPPRIKSQRYLTTNLRTEQPPSPPVTPPSSRIESPRSPAKRKRDPYSHLTPLQREIILSIQSTSVAPSIYPAIDNGGCWEGVHVEGIIRAVSIRYPQLSEEEFEESICFLLDEGYLYHPVDDAHYNITNS